MLSAAIIVGFCTSRFSFFSWDAYNSGSKSNQLLTKFDSQHRDRGGLAKSFMWGRPYFTAESRGKPLNHKTSLITTKTCVEHYFLLILVSSAPSNLQRRRDIRQTWDVNTASKPQWKTIFLIAQTQNQSESDSLLKEDETFGDLVRGKYYEHYWNQTLKVQMGFEWAARYCKFSFLLKMDDDVFVNMKALVSLLSDPNTPNEKLYMGNHYAHAHVLRYGKWKVSLEEYNRTTYPDFCPGFGYVLSSDVVDLFVKLFDIVPKFRMDDVYVGMLADKAGVKIVHNDGFVVGPERVTQCLLHNDTLVWHGIFGECLFKVYSQILTNFGTKHSVDSP